MDTTQSNFCSRVAYRGYNECWLWTGAKMADGYGNLVIQSTRRNVRAHRYSWELIYGPIPTGHVVCHRCDTRLRVNPHHLFIGTTQDNADDMVRKGRERKSAITDEQAKRIRQLAAWPDFTQDRIARIVGITRSSISYIVTRKKFSHVPATEWDAKPGRCTIQDPSKWSITLTEPQP